MYLASIYWVCLKTVHSLKTWTFGEILGPSVWSWGSPLFRRCPKFVFGCDNYFWNGCGSFRPSVEMLRLLGHNPILPELWCAPTKFWGIVPIVLPLLLFHWYQCTKGLFWLFHILWNVIIDSVLSLSCLDMKYQPVEIKIEIIIISSDITGVITMSCSKFTKWDTLHTIYVWTEMI